MSNFAWVTLTTNDTYSLGALVLAHSLRRAGTAHQLAVLVTPTVSEAMRARLKDVYNIVQEVDVLDSQDAANLALLARPELGVTFTKLHCWRLVQFEKCVFLDSDTLVLQNCDELFEREELSAAPDVSWPDCFNSGVFVYRPSLDTFAKITEFALQHGSFDGGDQGLLNQYFADWAHADINKHLPFVYNVTAYASYCYLPAFKQFRDKIKILHFAGKLKPWLIQFNSQNRTAVTPSDYAHAHDLIQLWWNIFCDNVHERLSDNMCHYLLILPRSNFQHHNECMSQQQQQQQQHHHQQQQQQQNQQQNQQQYATTTITTHVKEFRDPWQDYYKKLETEQKSEQKKQQEHEHKNKEGGKKQGGRGENFSQTETKTLKRSDVNANANANANANVNVQRHINERPKTTTKSTPTKAATAAAAAPRAVGVGAVKKTTSTTPTSATAKAKATTVAKEPQNKGTPIRPVTPTLTPKSKLSPTLTSTPTRMSTPTSTPTAATPDPLARAKLRVTSTLRGPRIMRRFITARPGAEDSVDGPASRKAAAAATAMRAEEVAQVKRQTDKIQKPLVQVNKVANAVAEDVQVTKQEAGLAGALSQLRLGAQRSPEQEAYENLIRRQCWESGQIDYAGQDSFDNIWKKISQTLEQKPAQDADNGGDKSELLTSADIEDGKIERNHVTGETKEYKHIDGGYEVITTTPDWSNGTVKTKVQTFYDPKACTEEDLRKEEENKRLVKKRLGKEVRIDSKTTMLTRAIDGGYEEVYTTVNDDGTKSSQTKTFFDSVPDDGTLLNKVNANKNKKTVTRKSSVESTDSADSRRVVQRQQKNVVQNVSDQQSNFHQQSTFEESRRVTQNIEYTENNRTVRKNSLQEQNIKSVTHSTTDGAKKKTKKTKSSIPPPPADFVQNETTTINSRRVPGGVEYIYSTRLESGQTITTSKTVYEEEETELTEEEIREYQKTLRDAEKHKNITKTKNLRSESGTKKVVPSENPGEVTTVETIKISGGTEFHYTTVTAEGVVKKSVKTVYDAVQSTNDSDEEEIVEEYEEEIIEPGEKNVRTIETVKQLPKKFEEEVIITHEKKEKKVKKSLVISH